MSDGEGTDDGEEDTDEGEECDATVGEANDCLNAYAAMIADISSQLSCDTPVGEAQNLIVPLCETPSECAALQSKCPDWVPAPECP
ncbi:MAG: hypothetical protein MUC50_18455 [Myxococcota bacterium]|jgi:hypothetical protein|nr:hypothetical protein [Myxococcota bacterium]